MNILLFDPGEELKPLSRDDPRGRHLVQILKVVPGQPVRAGIVGGPEGTIEITEITPEAVSFFWRPGETEALRPEAEAVLGNPGGELDPSLTILLGHPRPPVLRRLLKDLTTIGVGEILVAPGELTERSYLDSKVWEPRALKGALVEGASQGGSTALPEVHRFPTLRRGLDYLDQLDHSEGPAPVAASGDVRILLDKDAERSLFSLLFRPSGLPPVRSRGVLCVGPERGWTDGERQLLLRRGFLPAGLGDRVLRTETAALVGATWLRGFLRMEAVPGAE